jgi:hypothetical protein
MAAPPDRLVVEGELGARSAPAFEGVANVAKADFIGGWVVWVDEHGLLNQSDSFLGVEAYKQTSTEKLDGRGEREDVVRS